MKFTTMPILNGISVFRFSYNPRPPILVPGRDFCSLSYRISGRVKIKGDAGSFWSESESLTFLPRGYRYCTEISESGQMIVMHFTTENDCGGIASCVKAPYPKAMLHLFESTADHFASCGCDLALMSMGYEILSESYQCFSPEHNVPRKLKECKKYLDESVADPSLRISDLAEMRGVSDVYFRKEFRQYYGASPLEYVKSRRIENAKLLLQTGLYTVTEVAFRSGFESSSYFSAEFRRMTGTSPREYANQHQLN